MSWRTNNAFPNRGQPTLAFARSFPEPSQFLCLSLFLKHRGKQQELLWVHNTLTQVSRSLLACLEVVIVAEARGVALRHCQRDTKKALARPTSLADQPATGLHRYLHTRPVPSRPQLGWRHWRHARRRRALMRVDEPSPRCF